MAIPWQSIRIGRNPPPAGSHQTFDSIGRQLVTLVRSLEQPNNTNRQNQLVGEASTILRNLMELYPRRGLLQGNISKAGTIVAATTGQGPSLGDTALGGGGRKKKGKKRASSGHNGGGARTLDNSASGGEQQPANESTAAAQDEALLLSSLVRIFGGGGDVDPSSQKGSHDLTLIGLAANVATAISERIKSLLSLDTACVTAEYDLISASGKPMLTGIARTLHGILSNLHQTSTRGSSSNTSMECGPYAGCFSKERKNGKEHEHEHETVPSIATASINDQYDALEACLRASSSLLTLFGTRLSRSSSLVSELQRAGRSSLTIPDTNVRSSAAALLVSIPLAGGTGGGTKKLAPAELWNASVVETVAALFILLETLGSVKKAKSSKNVEHSQHMSKDFQMDIQSWTGHVRHGLEDTEQKGKALHSIIDGLVALLRGLLRREGYDARAQSILLSAQIPIDYILDLSEIMISFPSTAESLYYGTKKRLRMEPVQDGLLTPNQLAFDIANHLKAMGHDVFDSIVSSLTGPTALPYTRRIMRISRASLLTSCSSPLRKVLDPTGAIRLDGKRRRWLHSSLSVRTKAIESFKIAILACGSNAVVSPSRNNGIVESNKSDDGNNSITIIAGCLLEQLTWRGSCEEDSTGDWGTFRERINIGTVAAETLSTCLAVCMGYMHFDSRSLLDSIALKGLNSICGPKNAPICSWASMRSSLLNLGTKCISTPWPDGAMTSFMDELRQASTACRFDRDSNVSTSAYAALSICDALANPRAPPLLMVTRSVLSSDEGAKQAPNPHSGQTMRRGGSHLTAVSMSEDLRVAKEELLEAITLRLKDDAQAQSKASNKRAKIEKQTPLEIVGTGVVNASRTQITPTGESSEAARLVPAEGPCDTNTENEKSGLDASPPSPMKTLPETVGTDVIEKSFAAPDCKGGETEQAVSDSERLQQTEEEVVDSTENRSDRSLENEEHMPQDENTGGTNTDEDNDMPDIFGGGPDEDDI